MRTPASSSRGAATAARGRKRLGGPLEWGDTDKCLLVLGLTLPFGAGFLLRIRYLLAHPAAEPYLSRPALLAVHQGLAIAACVGLLLVGWGLVLRRRSRGSRLYVHLTLQSWVIAVSLGAYALGLFTSPIIVAFIAGALVGFLLFDLPSVWLAIGTGTAITVGTTVAERLGSIPYAPLIASFDRLGGAPSSEWIVGTAISCTVLLFAVYGISSFIISRWREREAQIAKAYRHMSRLVSAVDHAGEIVLMLDGAGTIEYANPAFEAITAYKRTEALGRSPSTLLGTADYDQAFFANVFAEVRTKGAWSGPIRIRKKDASEADVTATVSCVRGPGGEAQGYVAIAHDVTEKLLLEAQSRQAHKMEAIGQLVGGVAHDFNNQLTLVSLAVELLHHEENLSPEGRDALESLAEWNEESAALTSQLLTFSRKSSETPEPVDLVALAKRAGHALQRLLGERYKVQLDLRPNEGWVGVGPSQLLQVLFNLGVNARDAMTEGGRLEITVREVELAEPVVHRDATVRPGRYVVLQVRDHGQGIPETVLSRIYEPFFTTKQGRGTGLGLATVYGIVQQTGGAILCDSAAGRGTMFRIYFPKAEPRPGSETGLADPVPFDRVLVERKTVLVAEDEVRVLKIAQRILEKAGYQVLAAENVGQALDICDGYEGKIDLLLTDVVMPDGAGSYLAYVFNKSRPETRILYTSGYVDEATTRQGTAGEEIEFLAKPFTAEHLLKTVGDVLQAAA